MKLQKKIEKFDAIEFTGVNDKTVVSLLKKEVGDPIHATYDKAGKVLFISILDADGAEVTTLKINKGDYVLINDSDFKVLSEEIIKRYYEEV